jgi:post-segregation antitoxin (ccd killing protein)
MRRIDEMRNAQIQKTTKKAANLSLSTELLAEAKRLNINL